MLECNDQQKFMSDYQFETDREENAPQTLGDGGHLEEVTMKLTLFWGISPRGENTGPFIAASYSHPGTKRPYLKAKEALGQDKQEACII